MTQLYIPYQHWEDWKNGMWRRVSADEEVERLAWAIDFTGDWQRYGAAMKLVSETWTYTMINSLTNTSINPRAFVGHCACCFESGCPEYITRMAWKRLTDKQRIDADAIAQKIVNEWRHNARKNFTLYRDMAAALLPRATRRSSAGNSRQSTVIQTDMFSDT